MADLDGDGVEDLVSGSWPGDIHFFKGLGGRKFAEGRVIFKPAADDSNPTFKGYSVLQSSSPFAIDWDGDRDLDLVVGMIWGKVLLLRNDGTPKEPRFAEPEEILAGGKSLKTWLHKAGPWVADWDLDGAADLVVGDERGVWWCRGAEADGKRSFAEPVKILDKDVLGDAYRFKPCVADGNGDGLPDLLVGTTYSVRDGSGSYRTGGNLLVFHRQREAATPKSE